MKSFEALEHLLDTLGYRAEFEQVLAGSVSPEISSALADRLAEGDAETHEALTQLRLANVRKSILDALLMDHAVRQSSQACSYPVQPTHPAPVAVQ